MLVNGGGSVTLQFTRKPFQETTQTVFVPWNEIVVLDPAVVMSVGGSHQRVSAEEGKEINQEPCLQHDLDLLKPVVMSSWLPGMIGANPEESIVFGESQVFYLFVSLLGLLWTIESGALQSRVEHLEFTSRFRKFLCPLIGVWFYERKIEKLEDNQSCGNCSL